MAVVFANNASSKLSGALGIGDTVLSIQSGDAGEFPTPSGGDWFPLTLVDTAGNMEIVKATARSGTSITVVRAQEGTTAKAFASGSAVDLRVTKNALLGLLDKLNATGNYSFANLALSGGLTLGTDLAIAHGGTGASDAASARVNLGAHNASNLTAGKIPNARLVGGYDGVTNFSISGVLSIRNTSPQIKFMDTSSGQYSARMRVDGSNVYFDRSADDTTFGEVFRFELDTKIGYVGGVKILTGTINNNNWSGAALALTNGGTGATSAVGARTALGLGGLATLNVSDLVYTGSATKNTNFPVGTTLFVLRNGGSYTALNSAQTINIFNDNCYVTSGLGSGEVLAGTWRHRGDNNNGTSSVGNYQRTL